MTVIIGVFLFLMIYLVPQLSGFIRSMSGGHLPLQTQILLAISSFLVNHWWVLLAVPATSGVAVGLVLRFASEGLRADFDRPQAASSSDRADTAKNFAGAFFLDSRHVVRIQHSGAHRLGIVGRRGGQPQ